MGLDSFLHKRTYVRNYGHRPKEHVNTVIVKLGGKKRRDIKPERVSYITETVMEWYNNHSLHQWFNENVEVNEGCDSYVSFDVLQELLNALVRTKLSLKRKRQLLDDDIIMNYDGLSDDEFLAMIEQQISNFRKLFRELKNAQSQVDFYYSASW